MMVARLVLVVFLLWPGAVLALCEGRGITDQLTESQKAEIAEAAAETPFARGLFWRATQEDRELRLIGTMHLHDPRHDLLMSRVEMLLEGADLVLLESTPVEEAQLMAAMGSQPDLLFIQSGPGLPDLLDESTWRALAEAARARQIPPMMAARFQPWYLALSLAMPVCAMPDLLAGRRGLDHRIIDLAQARDVPMAALEPWNTLFDVMSNGTQKEQLDMLRLGLVPDDLHLAMMVSMLDGYFAEEVAEVWETSRVSSTLVPGLDPDLAEALFTEIQHDLLDVRNANWMPIILDASARHDTVVIAAGAAHLPGETGVLQLLANEGWTIERLQ